jgi:murein DD-endopeptidase MepM/ murein hydrolase activator NlpD
MTERLFGIAVLISLSCASIVLAMPAHAPRPGGMAVLRLDLAITNPPPIVRFDGKRTLVLRQKGTWVAVIGVPLDHPVGTAEVTVHSLDDKSSTLTFQVEAHAYREQHLSVARSYVDLSDAQLARVGRERKIIDTALTNWREQEFGDLALVQPVPGRRSSSFGLRRFFNEQPRSPHKGMDIAADRGTPVVSPGDGIVTATGDFYFNGNTVFVDHGQGFVTMYCHLDEIDVEEGQRLTTGTQLGTVGATGRVTGPHLHFATYLNGTAVDPALLLSPAD